MFSFEFLVFCIALWKLLLLPCRVNNRTFPAKARAVSRIAGRFFKPVPGFSIALRIKAPSSAGEGSRLPSHVCFSHPWSLTRIFVWQSWTHGVWFMLWLLVRLKITSEFSRASLKHDWQYGPQHFSVSSSDIMFPKPPHEGVSTSGGSSNLTKQDKSDIVFVNISTDTTHFKFYFYCWSSENVCCYEKWWKKCSNH